MRSFALALLASLAPCARAMVINDAAAFCGSASSSAISCLQGFSVANVPVFPGVCSCTCGSSLIFASAIPGGGVASSQPGCTATLCASLSPGACSLTTGYTHASYLSASAYLSNPAGITPTLSGPLSQCSSFTFTCTTAAALAGFCDLAMVGAVFSDYSNFNATEGLCVDTLGSANSVFTAALSSATVCATNNCNAPPAPSGGGSLRAGSVVAMGFLAAAALLI